MLLNISQCDIYCGTGISWLHNVANYLFTISPLCKQNGCNRSTMCSKCMDLKCYFRVLFGIGYSIDVPAIIVTSILFMFASMYYFVIY